MTLRDDQAELARAGRALGDAFLEALRPVLEPIARLAAWLDEVGYRWWSR